MNKVFQRSNLIKSIFFFVLFPTVLMAQTWEQETAQMKIGRLWGGITANGATGTFDFRSGFFPNDYDLLQHRGQTNDNFFGSGFRMACTDYRQFTPIDTIIPSLVFGPTNDSMPNGKVISRLTSFSRYKYSKQTINDKAVALTDFTVYDPTKFTGGTYDQIAEVTTRNILGVDVKRKILSWGQNFNDDYIIIDVELTNINTLGPTDKNDTLKNFYFNIQQSMSNNYLSYGSNPSPSSNEAPKFVYVWQHYYGARPGDSMRVFYFYHADDPATSGDNMGAPIISQGGRLLNPNFTYYSILHASKEPYTNPAQDINDPLQPKITYIGTDTKIPDPGAGEDPYGNKNFWALSGGYSTKYPMPGAIANTYHGINNDELGTEDFSNFIAGTTAAPNSRNFSTFGPYTFLPGQKLHFVYAVGYTGIGMQKGEEIGRQWFNGTLTNPPNMPNATTGWLPSNFKFPNGANEVDKAKDRWISMGIDSVMRSAWRAKWNFEHGYNIPLEPPPVDSIRITGYGEGVEIKWSSAAAEALSNFAGYRIMRRVSNADTIHYDEVYSSDANDKSVVHTYMDKGVIFGAQYYYYIQSKATIAANDVNADPSTRGKVMLSPRNFVPNVTYINPPRYSTDDMSKIRIAPNPYNITDPLLVTYGFTDQRGIIFFNLPAQVTVKIFTENGDLVQTIEHNSPQKAGSFTWDAISASQQVISSGVYIAVFQKPSGEISYQKFVVVR